MGARPRGPQCDGPKGGRVHCAPAAGGEARGASVVDVTAAGRCGAPPPQRVGGIVLISGPSTVNPAPRVVVGRPGHTPDNRLPNHLPADPHED